ncbi:Zinc finger, C2H2 type [Popillia japonica]|uniref:Zinc finger, C2H2 type n=1 Tax=Popillia japonica TaxID=7064 RepID=A0AAW1LRT2_POPJA
MDPHFIQAHSDRNTTDESNSEEDVSTESESSSIEIDLTILNGKYYKILKSDATNIDALCQLCLPKQTTIRGAKTTTVNFRNHLQRVHKNAFTECMMTHKKSGQQSKRKSQDEDNSVVTKQLKPYFTQEEFDEKILQFLINTIIQLNIIENKSFIALFEGLNVKVMEQKAAVSRLNDMYAAHVDQIINDIEKQKYICLTSDVWWVNRRNFIGVTAHWIDENFQRISVALSCQSFGPDGGDKTISVIISVIDKFKIDRKKVVSTILDYSTNNYGTNDSDTTSDTSEEDINFTSTDIASALGLRSSAGQIMYVVALTDIEEAFLSDDSIWNKRAQAITKCEALLEKVNLLNSCVFNHALPGSEIKKWIWDYNSIRQIIPVKDKVNNMCAKLKLDPFSEAELQFIEEYCAVMTPLVQTFDIFQNENNFYYGIVLPSIVSLKNKWEKMASCGFQKEGEFLRKLCLTSLNERFPNTLDLADDHQILAAVSYPRFKLRWYNAIPNNEITEDVIKQKLRAACQEFIGSNDFTDNDMAATRSDDDYFDFTRLVRNLSVVMTSRTMIWQQLDLMMITLILPNPKRVSRRKHDKRTDLNMLDNYQHVKEVFLKYNTALPSSASVDRLFSLASIVNAPEKAAICEPNLVWACCARHKKRSSSNTTKKHGFKQETSAVKDEETSENSKWTCRKCKQSFRTSRLLRAHRKQAHFAAPSGQYHNYAYDDQTKMYICQVCKMSFANRKKAREHSFMHEEKFTCEVCNEVQYSAYRYSLHLNQHRGDGKYICPICEYVATRPHSVANHINTIHLKKYLYCCKFCGKGYHDVVTYNEHEKLHVGTNSLICVVCQKEFSYTRYLTLHQTRAHRVTTKDLTLENQCNICQKSYSTPTTLKKHLRTHELNASNARPNLCEWCGKHFNDNGALNHHKRIHTGYKPYKCLYCQKSFSRKGYLVLHARTHSGEKPYCCSYCGKRFNQPTSLKVHVRGHTGERPYTCRVCNNGFTSKSTLKNHNVYLVYKPLNWYVQEISAIYLKESIKIEPTTISYGEHFQSNIEENATFKWRCKICLQFFPTRAVLRDHTRERHSASHFKHFANYSYNTQTQLYSCKMCTAEFNNRTMMWKHVLVHEQKFTCEICGEVQDSAYKFSLHLNKHSGDNNYKCPLCEYVTKITSSMSTHINSVHLKRFPYYCKHCGKGYHDAVMCTDHELKHFGNHSVPCVVCQKSFGYTRNLIHHQISCHKVPTTDASLNNQCDVCMKHYSSSSSLRKHKRIHQRAATPNVCVWCGKHFKDDAALKQHERIHTGTGRTITAIHMKTEDQNRSTFVTDIDSDTNKWLCKFCQENFETRALLRKHKQDSHWGSIRKHFTNYVYSKESKVYSCKVCHMDFISRAKVRKHFLIHQKFTCEVCGVVQDSAYRYSLHLNEHVGDDKYSCPLCQYVTKRKSSIGIHINGVHLKRYPYYCKHCGKGYYDSVSCNEHEKQHIGSNHTLVCVVCQKEFNYTRYLITHQIRNHKVPTIDLNLQNQCDICKKNYSSPRALQRHMQVHEDTTSDASRNLCEWNTEKITATRLYAPLKQQQQTYNESDSEQTSKWFCRTCRQSFESRTRLKKHRKEKHFVPFQQHFTNYTYSNETQLYTCKVCKAEFKNRIMMWKHVSVHEEKYTCQICNEIQDSAYRYSIHLSEHIGDNKYTCPLCPYVTRRKSSLARHINSIHLKRYPYYCKHCGKGYHDPVTFADHEQKHVGNHSITCIVCQKSFAYTRNLTHHQIHYHKVTTIDVQVKYQCEICKKYYTSPVTLRRHKQVHEINASDARPNLCEWCGKHFKDTVTLRHHKRIHTGCFGTINESTRERAANLSDRTCVLGSTGRKSISYRSSRNFVPFQPHFTNYTYSNETQIYTCKVCKAEFKNRIMMWNHVSVHEDNYTCQICNEIQDSAYRYSIHLSEHIGDNKYTCPLCPYVTRRKSSLARHINSIHLKRYPYYCKHCGKGYHDPVTFADHEQKHVGNHSITCIVCQKSFAYTRNLTHHQILYHKVTTIQSNNNRCSSKISVRDLQEVLHLTHHAKASVHKHQCEICKKYYTSPITLRRHKQVHEINASDAKPNLCEWNTEKITTRLYALRKKQQWTYNESDSEQTSKWFCTTCLQSFESRTHLKKHRKEKHFVPFERHFTNYSYSNETQLYTCKVCKAEFKNRIKMWKHVSVHEDKYTCEICNEIQDSAYRYSVHLSEHVGDNKYTCPLCAYITRRKGSIAQHINSIHLKRFPYYCKHCGKGYHDLVTLADHEQKHAGNLSITCIVCQKSFAYTRNLTHHQIHYHKVTTIDVQEKYQCDICKKYYASAVTLRRHKPMHEINASDAKPHLCEWCGKHFRDTLTLRLHERIHTGLTSAELVAAAEEALEEDPFTASDEDKKYVPEIDSEESDAEVEPVIEQEEPHSDESSDEEETPAQHTVLVGKDGSHWTDTPLPQAQTISRNILREKCGAPRFSALYTAKETFKSIMSNEICTIILRETNRKGKQVSGDYNEKQTQMYKDSKRQPPTLKVFNAFTEEEEKQTQMYKDSKRQPPTLKVFNAFTEEEFDAFLGILITAGVHKSNKEHISEMWNLNPYLLFDF